MQKIFLSVLTFVFVFSSKAQQIDKTIDSMEVRRIEKTLSSDDMQGRKTFSPGIEKAADFIAAEFKKAGLQTVDPSGTFFQEFTMVKPKLLSAKAAFDGVEMDAAKIIAFSSQEDITVTEKSGYETVKISAGDTLVRKAFRLISANRNYLVLVDTSQVTNFSRLSRFKGPSFRSDKSVIFVLTDKSPASYSIELRQEITEQHLRNVVGILPGKSRKDEYVIFSGHYDHLGIGRANEYQDSIFNGANDDAAGTTAVIMLAKYFSALHNNERTIVFAAFTAEEIGGYGSGYFSRQFDPSKVMAMFNIEMIGTESKWGVNSAYLTGYEKSDMGRILEKNLEGSQFRFYPDPYTEQQLFYRSDNATLARLGVPAHTISTSKMDSEKYYHTQEDEFETLDIKNMTEIIKAIAISSRTIVAGKDTPSRVDTTQLR